MASKKESYYARINGKTVEKSKKICYNIKRDVQMKVVVIHSEIY